MTWFKVDDQATFHPKVVDAGNAAFGALVRLGAHCNLHLTDGFVSKSIANSVASPSILRRLVNKKFLERVDGGYKIHDYLKYQSSKSEVTALRESIQRRVKRHRERVGNGVTRAVGNGDRNAAPLPLPLTDKTTDTENTLDQIPPVQVLDPVPGPAKRRPRGRKPKPIESAFDLEAIYRVYPRKVGRKPGMEALAKQIQTPADFETALRGVIAFAAAMDAERRPADKIPHFSTWVNRELWRDYADAGLLPATATGAAAKRNWREPGQHSATVKDVTDEF